MLTAWRDDSCVSILAYTAQHSPAELTELCIRLMFIMILFTGLGIRR